METNGEERRLVLNRVKCLVCGDVLISRYTHDYQTCGCPNKTGVDGGLDYLRYGAVDMSQVVLMCVYSDDDYEVVRDSFVWGTYGKNQEGPFKYVTLKDMSDKHIENILSDERIFRQSTISLFRKEMMYRQENGIQIPEE